MRRVRTARNAMVNVKIPLSTIGSERSTIVSHHEKYFKERFLQDINDI